MRLLGGLWKRTPLPVTKRPGLRPTPSRVRETLFNWLGQDLSGWRCLDAFAGSGALGLEAASRGADRVWLVEQDPGLVAGLRGLVGRLQGATGRVEVVRGDALTVLRAHQGLDLVFLDPPFEAGAALFESALQAARRAVVAQGLAYLESPQPWAEARLAELGWQPLRQGQAGAVSFALLRALTLGDSMSEGAGR